MRNWTGNHNDRTEIGDGITMLRNVSLIVGGQLSRRPQLGERFTLSAVLLSSLHPREGGDYLVAANGSGSLVTVNMSNGTSATVATGLDDDIKGCFVQHQQNVYYSNDFDSVKRINTGTATAVNAGILAATAAPTISSNSSGNLTAGTYLLRYRYKDTRTGYVSNPSPEVSRLVSASQGIRLSAVASTDPKVNAIVWERTTSGGSEFFQEVVGPNDTAIINIDDSDATAESGISTTSYYGDFGHEPPPLCELLCEHRGRLFGFKTSVRTNTAVSVALSAASVSGTGFSTNWAGRLVSFVGSSATSYVISSVSASGTSLTLSSNYAGSTSTAASMSIYGATPDMLYWSRAGFPESWKPSTWARRVLNNGDTPTALFSAYDTLWVAGLRTLKAFDYTSDPASAKISTIPTKFGIYNQRCIVDAEGRTFAFGPSGVWELRGRVPTPISSAIDQDVASIIDNMQREAFHGVYDYYEDTVTFWFCRSGDTSAKDGIAYHIPSGEWQMRTWKQGIRCSAVVGTTSKSPRPYMGCANGYTWRVADDLVADGLPTSMTSGVVTVDTGATTTSIPVTQSLPTGSSDLAGMMIYNPSTGTSKAITSNTATTITCAAFSAAPSAGTSLYLGSIDVYAQSEWWCGPSPHAMKRPSYLMLENVSDSTASDLRVQLFKDLSGTALSWTSNLSTVRPNGVTVANATTATVDLNYNAGVVYVPLLDQYARYWRYALQQEKPVGTLKLLDAKFLLQNRSDIDPKVKPT